MIDAFSVIVFSSLFLLGILFEILFLIAEYKIKFRLGTTFKGLASLCFVMLGFYCLCKNMTAFGVRLEIGLLLGLIGDVFLNLRYIYTGSKSNTIFAVGIFAFLFGHLMYINALIIKNPHIIMYAIGITGLISLASLPLLQKKTKSPSKKIKIIGAIYMPIVIGMFACGLSFGVLSGFSPLGVLFAAGSFFFMASDFMLVYYSFISKKHPIFRKLNLFAYYIGQIAIALCIIFA